MLCITDGVMGTEVHLEFQNELGVAIYLHTYRGRKTEGLESRRSGLNHSRAIPFRYDWVKTTLVWSVWKALEQSWKQSSH